MPMKAISNLISIWKKKVLTWNRSNVLMVEKITEINLARIISI